MGLRNTVLAGRCAEPSRTGDTRRDTLIAGQQTTGMYSSGVGRPAARRGERQRALADVKSQARMPTACTGSRFKVALNCGGYFRDADPRCELR
jgi:hypothetical protein